MPKNKPVQIQHLDEFSVLLADLADRTNAQQKAALADQAALADRTKAPQTTAADFFQSALQNPEYQNPEHPLRKMLNNLIAEGIAEKALVNNLYQRWNQFALIEDLKIRAAIIKEELLHQMVYQKFLEKATAPPPTVNLPKQQEPVVSREALQILLDSLSDYIIDLRTEKNKIDAAIVDLKKIITNTEEKIEQKKVVLKEVVQERAQAISDHLQNHPVIFKNSSGEDEKLPLDAQSLTKIFIPTHTVVEAIQTNPNLLKLGEDELVNFQTDLEKNALLKYLKDFIYRKDPELPIVDINNTANKYHSDLMQQPKVKEYEDQRIAVIREAVQLALGLRQNKSEQSTLESAAARIEKNIQQAETAKRELEEKLKTSSENAADKKSTANPAGSGRSG